MAKMLINKEKNITKEIDGQKVSEGKFHTKGDGWLLPHISDFIRATNSKFALDPFAGKGDMLEVMQREMKLMPLGYDIDTKLTWKINDSLVEIPTCDPGVIIITNPPFLAKYSASRKGVITQVASYYADNKPYDDLYKIALIKITKAAKNAVVIVPETYMSEQLLCHLCHSITIIEDNLFQDTTQPVCILVFDGKPKPLSEVKIYKNDKLVSNLTALNSCRIKPLNKYDIKFNDLSGQIGLRGVDLTKPEDCIKFMPLDELKYDRDSISSSSRLYSAIKVPGNHYSKDLSLKCNIILNSLREKSHDLLLSAFKGNTNEGKRRRRLDFYTARAIIEYAIEGKNA